MWRFAVDWERQGEWILFTRVWGAERDGRGLGGGVHAFTGVGPVGFVDTMVITTWDPPLRCVVRHTGRVVRGTAAFEVQPLGPDRSRFVWSEWLVLPLGGFGGLGFLLVRPFVLAGLRRSLRRFAQLAAAAERSPNPAG